MFKLHLKKRNNVDDDHDVDDVVADIYTIGDDKLDDEKKFEEVLLICFPCHLSTKRSWCTLEPKVLPTKNQFWKFKESR